MVRGRRRHGGRAPRLHAAQPVVRGPRGRQRRRGVPGGFDLRGIDCGTHTQWTEREASGAVDLAATKKAFDDAKPALFTGPQCAAHDRSMYRSTREADASAILPFSSGIAYMKACRAAGMAAEADAYRAKLEHFAQEAKLSPSTIALLEQESGANPK